MSLNFVLKWYKRIPPIHRDLELVPYKGRFWTPNEVLAEVKKGTEDGRRLQSLLEAGKFTDETTLKELAKRRLLKILKDLPRGIGIGTFSGRVYSKEDLIKLVKEERDVGRILIEQELKMIREELGI